MSTESRLNAVLASADHVEIDEKSKIIFFSDLHRGDGGASDDFTHNEQLYFYALERYYEDGFTYVEIGDGDELWENPNYTNITSAHDHVFWLLGEFHKAGRFYLIWGNHNRQCKNPQFIQKHLNTLFNERTGENEPLFPGLKAHEGIVLDYRPSGKGILVVHGHQGQLLNDGLWWLGRWGVRNVWRPLQVFGANDPTSPARNYNTRARVEEKIESWARQHNCPVIAGHTHRPIFPKPGQTPYFNDGSCVHPRAITGLEIESGQIALIKWHVGVAANGGMRITRMVLEGPQPLAVYLS